MNALKKSSCLLKIMLMLAGRKEVRTSMTKCMFNPIIKCEYADCEECPLYKEVTDGSPDPDEVFETEREEKMNYDEC